MNREVVLTEIEDVHSHSLDSARKIINRKAVKGFGHPSELALVLLFE